KKGHVERFLKHKDKVKVTIMFRGREVTHPERGVAILDRLAEELSDYAIVEQRPLQDGRNMTMMLGPSKAILAGQFDRGANGDAPAEVTDGEAVEGQAALESNGAAPAQSVEAPVENTEAPAQAAEAADTADAAETLAEAPPQAVEATEASDDAEPPEASQAPEPQPAGAADPSV
ncbi:MAG TPA: translation initiation factor IF-3, partial [Solirubrobacteraceae bacterium]